jgi:hypothetical protein
VQDGGGCYRHRRRIHVDELAKSAEERAGDVQPDIDSVSLTHISQGALDLPTEVKRDAIWCLCCVETALP